MKKHLKRFLSMMMAVLLCFGIVPSNAFAAEYDYDGYISISTITAEDILLAPAFRRHLVDTAQINLLNCELTI